MAAPPVAVAVACVVVIVHAFLKRQAASPRGTIGTHGRSVCYVVVVVAAAVVLVVTVVVGAVVLGRAVVVVVAAVVVVLAGVVVGGGFLAFSTACWKAANVAASTAPVGSTPSAVWLPYYPVWWLVYVGISVLVVYALVAHFEPAPTAAPQPEPPGV